MKLESKDYEVCPVKEDGWCSRHNRYHRLRDYELALDPTITGAMYRHWWDEGGDHILTPISITPAPPQYPSKIEMAANLAKNTAVWVSAGKPERTDEECAAIHKICETCPFFDAKQDRCTKCGCGLSANAATAWIKLMGIPDAIRMKTHHCPIGKW